MKVEKSHKSVDKKKYDKYRKIINNTHPVKKDSDLFRIMMEKEIDKNWKKNEK